MPAVFAIVAVVVFWRFLVLTAGEVFERAGLSPEAARFEARSALTGSGYTTSESETVVRDPASRRVASALFMVGFVGPVTILGLLGFGFLLPSSENQELRLVVLLGLFAGIGFLERIGVVKRVGRWPARMVAKRVFRARVPDTWMVVGRHAIASLQVSPDSGLTDRPIGDLFGDRDITVLLIRRNTQETPHDVPSPTPDELTTAGDLLILFGGVTDLTDLRSNID